MQISLTDPLTEEQALFLHAIDTFYEISSKVIMFQSFAQYKRTTRSWERFNMTNEHILKDFYKDILTWMLHLIEEYKKQGK